MFERFMREEKNDPCSYFHCGGVDRTREGQWGVVRTQEGGWGCLRNLKQGGGDKRKEKCRSVHNTKTDPHNIPCFSISSRVFFFLS